MIKIAITGKKNSGKNTLTNLILNQYNNKSYKIFAFADPIKEIIKIMFPWADNDCLYGPSYKREFFIPNAMKNDKPLSYRQAIIDIGMQGRSYNSNHWVDIIDIRMKQINSDIVIVSDLRFANEFEYLRKENFKIIKIIRSNKDILNHVSETDLDSFNDNLFDYIIYNNKNLSDLEEEVKKIKIY